MRAYHHFSVNRSWKHLAVVFALLLIPLFGLYAFSYISGISFFMTVYDLATSMWRMAVAFVFALVIAWVLVVVLIRGKTEGPALAFFDVIQSLPTFTILPIAVHYFGESEHVIITFLTVTIVWPIVFSIVSSIKQADPSWKDAVAMSRIRGLDYIRYYLIPVTAPGIVTGAIIGLGDGWEALIATEIILEVRHGLGPFFQAFADNTTETLLGVLIFLSLIFIINKLLWLPLLEKSHTMVEQ
jgi:ABC-type nitrate/sulfonate/bicarbonate transport system permease component